jgi:PAS domain S-box-containing protein
MSKGLRILLLEDNPADAVLIAVALNAAQLGHVLKRVETRETFLDALRNDETDVILSDLRLPSFSGTEALKIAHDSHPEIPFLFVSGTMGEEMAIETLKQGAADYVLKDRLVRLAPAVDRALEAASLRAMHKRAQAALRESELKFRNLFNNIGVGMYRSRLDGSEILDVNAHCLRILGRTREEMLGMPSAVEIWADPDERAEMARRLKAEGKVEGFEFRLLRKSGEVRCCLTSLNLDREQGILEGSLVDITERKQADEELRESQQRLSLALSSSSMGVWRWDIPADRRTFDDQVCRLLGLDPARFSGRAAEFFGVLHPDDRPMLRAALARTLEQDAPYELEYRAVWPDASVHHIAARGRLQRDAAGRPLRVEGIIWDVTERTKAQAAQHESDARFRSLVEGAPDAIFVQKAGRFTYLNSTMLRLFGAQSQEELLGRDFMSRVAPEYHEAVRQRIALQRRTGKPASLMEMEYLRLDDSRVWVEVTAIAVAPSCETEHVVFVRDITERKKSEVALANMQRLESLGVLAGGIAHDFNNILTGLVGNLSLMRADLPADAAALRELVDEAELAAQGATGLARQLLTFAKGGAPIKKVLDLGRLLRDAAGFVLRGSGASCEFDLAEGLWPVEADPGQMEQVVHNLALNAAQSMGGGGAVRIRAANAEMPQGRYVEVAVADQGTGIPENDLAHVFEPYFTTKAKGRGLGLSIVHSIITRHGGSISVDSKVGQGTVFRFLLPACAAAAEAPVRETAPSRVGGRVLIMDDDPVVTRILTRMLKRQGCECAEVLDGEAALSAYAQAEAAGRRFSLVIMDLTIPGGMGGKDAVRRLKEKFPDARVAVSSGYANDPALANFAEFGFDAALTKPYRLEDVSKLLR